MAKNSFSARYCQQSARSTPGIDRILGSNTKTKIDDRDDFAAWINSERDEAIEGWYGEGGDRFYKWARDHFRMKTGEPLSWVEPYQVAFYTAMGCPWIERIVVEKGAQMGFTELLIAWSGFLLADIHIPIALGFEAEGKLRDIVSPRIQPAFDFIKPIQAIRERRFKATRRKDTDFQQRKMTVGGVEMTFFYTSTVSAKKNQEQSAPSSLRSFTGWAVGGDEIELWHESALDIVVERQGACPMPTKPLRLGSTPGMEGGVVDTQVKMSGLIFEWKVPCPHCGSIESLDAFGSLLKPFIHTHSSGEEEEYYVDTVGRPKDWHCHDRTSRESMIRTAYIGCSSCGGEFDRDTLNSGYFAAGTGEEMMAYCDRITRDRTPMLETVAIRLPRLASVLFRAPERIRKLLVTLNPADQIQQGLGKAVSIGNGKISLKRLRQCVDIDWKARIGDRKPDLVVVGCDQGRAANWTIVQHWYLGEGTEWEEQVASAFKVVVWHGDVNGFDGLGVLCDEWAADLVGFDGEPEVQLAADFARKRSGTAFVFDQVALKGENWRESERLIQGEKVPTYAIHRTFGLDCVRNRIYAGLQAFAEELSYNPGDDQNLLYHYLTSDRKSSGRWEQVPGTPDHWFHADNFAEMAVLVSGYPKGKAAGWGSIDSLI